MNKRFACNMMLIMVGLMVLLFSACSSEQAVQKPANEATPAVATTAEPTPTDVVTPVQQTAPQATADTNVLNYSEIGMSLMKDESLGFLRLGAADKGIVEKLGEPESKTDVVMNEVDGLEHQQWLYETKGITLDMVKQYETWSANWISIVKPCNYATERKIGLGSTKEAVLGAYGKFIDPKAQSAPALVVAGTEYGGIQFGLENGKVVSIFIGASGE